MSIGHPERSGDRDGVQCVDAVVTTLGIMVTQRMPAVAQGDGGNDVSMWDCGIACATHGTVISGEQIPVGLQVVQPLG